MNRCIQKFREIGDKKGGGFMILWKDKINRRMIEIKTKHSDIMLIKFHEGVNVFYMLVVYMATNDNSRNKIILAELRTIIKKYEDDELFILGDFNSHLGFLGPQKINLNGHNILKLINEMDLILIYDDPLCVGEITWQQNNHKSAIDFILANPKIYPRIVKMFIDEQSEDLDISDHKLITMEIKISRENNNISKKNETVSFFKINDETKIKFLNYAIGKIDELNDTELEDFEMNKFEQIIKESAVENMKTTINRNIKGNNLKDPIQFNEERKSV